MCSSYLSKLTKVDYNFGTAGASYLDDINADTFDNIALQLFRYQYGNNELYRQYANALHIDPAGVHTIRQIPFLPISFFKTHRIATGIWPGAEFIFESSGTTGETPSRHYVKDLSLYERSLLQGFEAVYGPVTDWTILALLPSYLERQNASLVHMAKTLMQHSGGEHNGFYLDEWDELIEVLRRQERHGARTLLLGVTFALLDFAEQHALSLHDTVVMETGGMKGRRREWTREQVHEYLRARWGLQAVHSEYGMTELLSQAYAVHDGVFAPAATMKVLVRDINDPLDVQLRGSGCLNIIDLANVHSCAFIATEDVGKVKADGHFEVIGRMDHAALRGCNLMVL